MNRFVEGLPSFPQPHHQNHVRRDTESKTGLLPSYPKQLHLGQGPLGRFNSLSVSVYKMICYGVAQRFELSQMYLGTTVGRL